MNEGYDIWHGEPIGILSPITLRLLHGTDGSRLTSHKCPGYIATYGNEKNKRRQKGMKESCTSGRLGCQDISSFTGICCCCCCLASLYLPCDGDSECRRRRWTCLPGVDWLDGSAQSREKRLFFTHH